MATTSSRIIEIIIHDFNSMARQERTCAVLIARWIRRWYHNHVTIGQVKAALNTLEARRRLWINSTRAEDYVDGVKTDEEMAGEKWWFDLHSAGGRR
jgi:hypothetical protein